MDPLTYLQAIVLGVLQGVTELVPISSLGHSILVPAWIGGSWEQLVMNQSAPESPYLAFIVALHVATASALIVLLWRDWVGIVGGFISSCRYRRITTIYERLAWLIVLSSIPAGIAGLLLEHSLRTLFAKPLAAAIFLTVNGLILLGAEWLRRNRVPAESVGLGDSDHPDSRVGDIGAGDIDVAVVSRVRPRDAGVIGVMQTAALLPGISRAGTTMTGGLLRGLTHEEALRFSFLLATPIILAAGLYKVPDLAGPLGDGIRGQAAAGAVAAFVAAFAAVRFLERWFRHRSLLPFAIYCLVAGLVSIIRFV